MRFEQGKKKKEWIVHTYTWFFLFVTFKNFKIIFKLLCQIIFYFCIRFFV